MEAGTRSIVVGLAVSSFLSAVVAGLLELETIQPPVGLAAPTALCVSEVKAVALLFLASVVLMEPARGKLAARVSGGFLGKAHAFSTKSRLALFIGAGLGMSVFAFWSISDMLGGYNGYNYAFREHPILGTIYADFASRVPYVGGLDKGTQASLFFILACVCVTALRLHRGLGIALKDTVTLFAAPILILLEAGIWYFAPQDMTWHVTDFLWIGGTADGGYRSQDTGGSYVFSNWFVLFVCIFLVASRLPRLSSVSRTLWARGDDFSL